MKLDLDAPEITPQEMTKSGFARHRGVSNGRISQMISDGMPILDNGRVPVADAEAWIEANVAARDTSLRSDVHELSRVKIEREAAQRDLLQLQVEEKNRRLVDREAVALAIFERARAERDAHLAWVSRIVPKVAAETGADLGKLYAALDREMRQHLGELAEMNIDELSDEG